MKRPYYIMSSGRLRRRQNTIYFEPQLGENGNSPTGHNDNVSPGHGNALLGAEEELLAGFTEESEVDPETGRVKRKPIPVEDIEAFYCFSELDFNTKFFNFLSQNRISLHLFNYYGHYSGSFVPREYLPSGFTVVEQVRAFLDPHRRMLIARELIDAASFNILKNLQYFSSASRQKSETGQEMDFSETIKDIEALRETISTTETTSQLMGLEGNIRDRYYTCWNTILAPAGEAFSFNKRTKRPPDNAVNALVSFCNGLVYATVLGEIYHTHLNPTISYLHGPGERRFSLALDLSEIFKPILVDKMIFKLLNTKQIQIKHFRKELKMCYLEESGRKIVLQEYDERLKTTIKHRSLGRSVSYRHLIRLEAYKLVNHLLNGEQYKAFRAWW